MAHRTAIQVLPPLYGGKRELIIKFYMQGMGGHADTLGYCLMPLTLNSDDTWNLERSEFVLDK